MSIFGEDRIVTNWSASGGRTGVRFLSWTSQNSSPFGDVL